MLEKDHIDQEIGRIRLTDLIDPDDLQKIQDQFCDAVGVASVITAVDGRPITRPSNFCRLCEEIVRKTDLGLENCMRSDAELGKKNLEGPTIKPCLSSGLWDAGAAITIDGNHIASWLVGQVRDGTQTEDQMRKYARKIGANEEEMIEAFEEVTVMSKDSFKDVANYLFTMANMLSRIAYQNLQQRILAEEREGRDQKLKESEKRFREIIELSRDIHYSQEYSTGKMIYMSQSVERILGYTTDEMREMDLEAQIDLFHPDDRSKVIGFREELLEQASEGMDYYELEFRMITKDGRTRNIQGTYYLTFENDDPTGIPMYITGLLRDVTEKKMADKELKESEKRFRTISELSSDYAYCHRITEKGLEPIWYIGAFERITGYTPEELFEQGGFRKLIHPEDIQKAERYATSLLDGNSGSLVSRVITKDGSVKWIRDNGKPWVDEDTGEIVGSFGSASDITDQMFAEEGLRTRETELSRINERMNLAKESAGIGIWDLDLNKNELIWDERMYQIYGVDPLKFEGAYEAWKKGLHPDDRERSHSEVRMAIEGKKEFDTEFRIITPGGQVKHLKANAIVLKDEKGKPFRMLGTNIDISGRKDAEQQVAKGKEEVEFYMDLLGHDLGNIHQGISGSLQMLRGKIDPDPDQRKILDLANESIDNARALTREVILLSRLREKEPEMVEMDLRSVIERAVDQIVSDFADIDVDIPTNIGNDIIRAEPIIMEMFYNILHNAIRLQDDHPSVEISSESSSERVRVSITDRGPGIPDKMKGVLFKKFGMRGEKVRRGLGLSLCKVLADRYNASIHVEDRVEGDHTQGARFILDFPISFQVREK